LKSVKNQDWSPVESLRDELEERLKARCPNVVFLANDVPRLPNTTVIAMKGVKSATQVMNFDLAGIALSAGSACSSGKVKPSRILMAMGIPESLAGCSIRVSLGLINPPDLIDRFLAVWMDIYKRTKK
jgi:cysteine desulfurase